MVHLMAKATEMMVVELTVRAYLNANTDLRSEIGIDDIRGDMALVEYLDPFLALARNPVNMRSARPETEAVVKLESPSTTVAAVASTSTSGATHSTQTEKLKAP